MSSIEFIPSVDTTSVELLEGHQIDCSSLLAESPLVGLGYLPSPNAPSGSADRYATLTLGSMFKVSENGESFGIRSTSAEMPAWMERGTNLAAACWLGRALVHDEDRVAVIDLNHAESITENLSVFVDELSATDLCGVVAAEPEGNPSPQLSQAANYVKRIIGSLDHMLVVSTDTSRVELAHTNMEEMVQSAAELGVAQGFGTPLSQKRERATEPATFASVAA